MRTPIITLKNRRATRGQHAGLLLQRYLCENATGEGGNPEEKRAIVEEKRAILEAAIHAAMNAEVRELYKAAFVRWKESLPELTASNKLQTQGRLIVGLGSENVLETGIRLNHTYGLPILPGTALKGLAAHYCDQVWGQTDKSYKKGGVYHQLLFGTTDDSGCVTFHDAWYVPESSPQPLALDVMTPHHPEWNNNDNPVAPTDFDSPIPVPFLSTTGEFHIAVAWHGPKCDPAGDWTQLALALVTQATSEWGIGGKTSSGYGRLVKPSKTGIASVAPTSTTTRPPQIPKPGEAVEAVLLEEKTKKGGWKAKHETSRLSGPIQNTGAVPGDKNAGDKLTLIVALANKREIAFRYPTAADEQRAKQSKGKPKGGSSGKSTRGGRR